MALSEVILTQGAFLCAAVLRLYQEGTIFFQKTKSKSQGQVRKLSLFQLAVRWGEELPGRAAQDRARLSRERVVFLLLALE